VVVNFAGERIEIAGFKGAGKDARGEIAIGTLLRAERVRDVDSGHSFDCIEAGRKRVCCEVKNAFDLFGFDGKMGSIGKVCFGLVESLRREFHPVSALPRVPWNSRQFRRAGDETKRNGGGKSS
jgi:hypothetical protein